MTTTAQQQVRDKLDKAHSELMVHWRQYDAEKQLFDAACFVGDGVIADVQRNKLHAELDHLLDQTAAVITLTRQLMELPG